MAHLAVKVDRKSFQERCLSLLVPAADLILDFIVARSQEVVGMKPRGLLEGHPVSSRPNMV